MKNTTKVRSLFLKQFSFSYLKLQKKKQSTKVSCLIRLKYNQSLIAKSLILINLVSSALEFKLLKSSFLKLEAETFLKFKGVTTFSSIFKTESRIKDIVFLIKKNGLENIYDFFNFPVKFNLIKTQNLNQYIADVIKSY